MINIQVTRYREPTAEEIERQEEHERKNGYRHSGFNETDILTPMGRNMRQERILNVEITNEQFESIRKAILDKF